MPHTIEAVIGAGFGDEGKGLTTDYLAYQHGQNSSRVLVIRYNSSAQAGHTVQTQSAQHVFHHFGSGALAGAASHLASRFVVHPMLFRQEQQALAALGARLDLTIDPRCAFTLPCDMAINQALENSRGASRHGSCGVGFGETIERQTHMGFSKNINELSDMKEAEFLSWTQYIMQEYVPYRMSELDLEPILPKGLYHLDFWKHYFEDVQYFLTQSQFLDPSQLNTWDHLIFEGAQGLRLDEELGQFPHVTRSKTGLPWIMDVLKEANLSRLFPYYATRSYLTRHGAGLLPFENQQWPPYFKDLTNQPNTWQGSLRYAPLDETVLQNFIERDIERAKGYVEHFGLMISCLDQWSERLQTVHNTYHPQHFGTYLQKRIGAYQRLESFGPTRETVHTF